MQLWGVRGAVEVGAAAAVAVVADADADAGDVDGAMEDLTGWRGVD